MDSGRTPRGSGRRRWALYPATSTGGPHPPLLWRLHHHPRRAGRYSDAFQAAAIAALLTNHLILRRREEVHVVGTSYGGLVARQLARSLAGIGEKGKVVVCDSDLVKGEEDDAELAAKGGVEEVTELMAPADSKGLRRLMALCVHRPSKFIPDFIVHDLLRKYFADKREEKIQPIKGIVTEEEDPQLNSPLPQEVLIIWGEFDQIFPVEKAYKVKEMLGEKATVKMIPNTGHLATPGSMISCSSSCCLLLSSPTVQNKFRVCIYNAICILPRPPGSVVQDL